MNRLLSFIAIFCYTYSAIGQNHHSRHRDTSDLTFKGTKINPYSQEYDSTGKWQINGYIDSYISQYSDTANSNGFVKFPTINPRNKQFGLNILQLSVKYQAKSFRGTGTLFTGDCPKSSWSADYNFIQEANLGFKLYKKLWFDMGFFRTHIGLESIQPRENMTLSLATTSYFEPYFMSGAKLTYEITNKWILQANAFNSFNQFIDNNKKKAIGLSTAYTNDHAYLVFSTLLSNETSNKNNWFLYNNVCFSYHTKHVVFGAEANLGVNNYPSGSKFIVSSLLAGKYRITPQFATYLRAEAFHDPFELLTGPVFNENHNLVGMEIVGLTHGWEFKPIPNSYVRAEARVLSNYNQHIFSYKDGPSKIRTELNFGIGLWF